MKKVLFLSNTANFSKFNLPYMRWFREQGWRVDYASAGEENVSDCDNQYKISIARSPLHVLKNLKGLCELKELLCKNQYDILHCHTPMGGVLGRLAKKMMFVSEPLTLYWCYGGNVSSGIGKSPNSFFYKVSYKLKFIITLFKRKLSFKSAVRKILGGRK